MRILINSLAVIGAITVSSVAMLLSLVIKVMHEKYGWGFKRLGDLSEAIVDEWNEVDNSEMTLKGYQEYVYQMTGVKFKTTD